MIEFVCAPFFYFSFQIIRVIHDRINNEILFIFSTLSMAVCHSITQSTIEIDTISLSLEE